MRNFETLDDIDVRGKRVLLRADLNVPVKDGEVTDATRIERLAPTIEALIDKGAKVDRDVTFRPPQGQARPGPFAAAPDRRRWRRRSAAGRWLLPRIASAKRRSAWSTALQPGQVALLENLRFHQGEEANSPDFARALAELGDVYVDDAFSAAHRAHASIAALARLLPAAAGKLMEAELEALTAALETPKRPVLALIGGAKVSTKLDLLRFLIGKVDMLAIGGAMANTLLLAEGKEVGRSLCERDMTETARQILALARERNCRRHPARRRRRRPPSWRPGVVTPRGSDRRGAARCDDPRHRRQDRRPHRRRSRRGTHPRVERAARRLRDAALRPRHDRGGEESRRAHPGREVAQRRRRRRHGRGARRGGSYRRTLLCLDGGRRLPRMAGRPRITRRRRPYGCGGS